MKDLEPYPFIQFEQGEEGSFFFAEEAVWPENSPKQINVTDRATILNFIIGLNGYTVCTGIDTATSTTRRSSPCRSTRDETMTVGWISNERAAPVRRGRDLSGPAARGHRQARLRTHRITPSRTGRGTVATVIDMCITVNKLLY